MKVKKDSIINNNVVKKAKNRNLCLNCGNTFKGSHCPLCGQKAATKRLKFFEIAADLINSFIGGDNKFLRTCRELFSHPGYMVRDYLLGKRTTYYNPLQLYVFLLTVYAFIAYMIGESSNIFEKLKSFQNLNPEAFEDKYASFAFILESIHSIFSNKLYGTLLFSLIAIFPFHRLFRKRAILRPDGIMLSLNHTEHFYALMYCSCIDLMICIALLPFCLIDGSKDVIQYGYNILPRLFAIILYKQLLGVKWLRCILTVILAYFLTILIGIFLFCVVLISAVGIDVILM